MDVELNFGLTPTWVCNGGLVEALYCTKFKGHCHCTDFPQVEVVSQHQGIFICLPEMNLICFAIDPQTSQLAGSLWLKTVFDDDVSGAEAAQSTRRWCRD